MERPNTDTSFEGFGFDFLFDEDTNNFDFPNIGYSFQGIQDAPLLEETRQTANEVLGSEVESEGSKARDMRSHNISETTIMPQSVQSTDANSEFDAPSEDKRSKKRKIDREYRARQKEIKQKQEEELRTLRQEKTKLELELEAEKQKADKLKSKSTDQINDVDECRIVFESNFPNEDAKRRLMRTAAGFPGITSIKMDAQRKRMTLEGIDIDPLPLRDMLKKICNTKLVYFNMISMPEKTEDKKKDEKKDKEVELVKAYRSYNPHSYYYLPPQGPPSLHPPEFTEIYGATSAPRFSFENAVTIFLVILVLLILIRPAVYNDILFRFMKLFAIFFDAIEHGVRGGQVLMCDIYKLLCN